MSLDFDHNLSYSIKILDFTGISTNNRNSVDIIDEIINAISKCSLKDSLVQIKSDFDRDQIKIWRMILNQYGLSKIELINS